MVRKSLCVVLLLLGSAASAQEVTELSAPGRFQVVGKGGSVRMVDGRNGAVDLKSSKDAEFSIINDGPVRTAQLRVGSDRISFEVRRGSGDLSRGILFFFRGQSAQPLDTVITQANLGQSRTEHRRLMIPCNDNSGRLGKAYVKITRSIHRYEVKLMRDNRMPSTLEAKFESQGEQVDSMEPSTVSCNRD